MKPKRIKAIKTDLYLDGSKPVPCYVLRQSDVRALAEQIEDAWLRKCCELCGRDPDDFKHDQAMRTTGLLYALKRAGITPGRILKPAASIAAVRKAFAKADSGDVVVMQKGTYQITPGDVSEGLKAIGITPGRARKGGAK